MSKFDFGSNSSMNLAQSLISDMVRLDDGPVTGVEGALMTNRMLVMSYSGTINPPEYRERILDLSDRALDEAVPMILDTLTRFRLVDVQELVQQVNEWIKIQREQIASGTHHWSHHLGVEFNEEDESEELEDEPYPEHYVNLILSVTVSHSVGEPADKAHHPIVSGCAQLRHNPTGDTKDSTIVDSVYVLPGEAGSPG